MLPILGMLAESGLGLLAGAIQAKGKEVIEQKLGVKIPDSPSSADIEKLRQLQYEHEEHLVQLGIEREKLSLEETKALLDAAKNENDNVAKQWAADMASDSWLSKNIRPMALIAILAGYFIFAAASAFGLNANESYVTLLGNWGQLIMGAYFGGRTAEKIFEMAKGKK